MASSSDSVTCVLTLVPPAHLRLCFQALNPEYPRNMETSVSLCFWLWGHNEELRTGQILTTGHQAPPVAQGKWNVKGTPEFISQGLFEHLQAGPDELENPLPTSWAIVLICGGDSLVYIRLDFQMLGGRSGLRAQSSELPRGRQGMAGQNPPLPPPVFFFCLDVNSQSC